MKNRKKHSKIDKLEGNDVGDGSNDVRFSKIAAPGERWDDGKPQKEEN